VILIHDTFNTPLGLIEPVEDSGSIL